MPCIHLRENRCPMLRAAGLVQWKLNKPAGGHFGVAIEQRLTLAAVIARLIRSKRKANKRRVYVVSILYYLQRFAAGRRDMAIADFTTEHVEEWLNQFHGQHSCATWLNRISTLFSFALRRGYISKNPCAPIDRVSIDRKPPVIVTVEQSRELLRHCPLECKPYLVLALFAGIRPDEIARMDWHDVCFETGTVRIDGKTRHHRIITLEPMALALLKPLRMERGPVAPSKYVLRGWKRRCRALLGGKWTADILRHSFASYMLAKIGDVGKVAALLGNSPAILLRHYNRPVTAPAAEAFFALFTTESAQLFFELAGHNNA